MKSRAFNELIASEYNVDLKTVTVYARFLKQAGLLTSGARGINAPDMTPLDAARMTIAMMATDRPARAVARLNLFGRLPFRPDLSEGQFPEMFGTKPGVTLEEVLANLFSSDVARSEILDHRLFLKVHESLFCAEIGFDGGRIWFEIEGYLEERLEADMKGVLGIRQTRSLSSIELSGVHIVFFAERLEGAPWEEIKSRPVPRGVT